MTPQAMASSAIDPNPCDFATFGDPCTSTDTPSSQLPTIGSGSNTNPGRIGAAPGEPRQCALSSDQLGTINQKLGSIGLPPIDEATPEQIQECVEKNQAAGNPVIGTDEPQSNLAIDPNLLEQSQDDLADEEEQDLANDNQDEEDNTNEEEDCDIDDSDFPFCDGDPFEDDPFFDEDN